MNAANITLTNSFNHSQKAAVLSFDNKGIISIVRKENSAQSVYDKYENEVFSYGENEPVFIISQNFNSSAIHFAHAINEAGEKFGNIVEHWVKKNKISASYYYDIGGGGRTYYHSWEKDSSLIAQLMISHVMGGVTVNIYTPADRRKFWKEKVNKISEKYNISVKKAEMANKIKWAGEEGVVAATKYLLKYKNFNKLISPKDISIARGEYNSGAEIKLSGPRWESALEIADIIKQN